MFTEREGVNRPVVARVRPGWWSPDTMPPTHTGSNGNANRGAICVDMEEARKVARDVSLPVLDGERPDHCTPGERPA